MPSADLEGTSPQSVITIGGSATPEEVAAVVAVLTAASGGSVTDAGAGDVPSLWADHGRAVRSGAPHGRGAWRASGQPR